ncbi:MAG: TonB-dependent receptor [Pigmentiphaga sp.]|uniref:TonB-dependent receptor plug domain-containing protein n=1 Tax=Pigmentiphaga sp. TaxID=1977564 RepID=UPI0029B9F33C|nr:TonB-dependent receptor [Pigmentiphaga sp.]MDX3905947.1 TonB-dependent receptor [Pigmentiphaga sp.]
MYPPFVLFPSAPRVRWAVCAALSAPVLAAGAASAEEAHSLAPIVVTGTRTEKSLDDTPIRTEIVTREEIDRTHARTLTQALENIPGLQLREIHGKSGYELSLQGLSSDQVLVLIDGLPISASTGSTVDLSQYLLTDVDHIEVVKGATSAQHGSAAMGGVINVITRPAQPGLSGRATLDAGSYGDQNSKGGSWRPANRHGQFFLQGGNEQLRGRIAADVLDDDGFGINPDAWSRQGDEIRRQQYSARVDWLPSARQRYFVDGSIYREDDTQRYTTFVPPNLLPQRKTEIIERDRITGGGQWSLANGTRLQLKGVGERYDSTSQAYSNEFPTTRRNAKQDMGHLTAQVDLPAWRGQLWQFGADYHYEKLSQDNNGVSEFVRSGAVDRSSKEVFVQNDIIFNDTWELLLGARYQDDSDFGGHFAPKASLRGTLLRTRDWTGVLRASAGQGYRVPNLKERYYLFDHSALGYMVLGNPDLKPESSNSLQLGGTLTFREDVTLEVNAFLNRVKDLIQTDMNNVSIIDGVTAYTYRNIARARTRGIETGVRWQATPALSLTAGYTFTDAKNLDTGSELTRRPRHIGRLGMDWRALPDTTISVRTRMQSSELVSSDDVAQSGGGASSGGRSPGWTTMDLVVNQKVGRQLTLFAGVNNLFDRQRDFSNSTDFGPLRGRFIYVGARYAFGANP